MSSDSVRAAPLVIREAPPAQMLIRAANVLDPRAQIDGAHDVLIRDGEIAEIGAPNALESPPGAQVVEARGAHLLPGFFDPHVHLRSPGQEHKEDIGSGTAAAAAGGFTAILAMPNTSPPIDSAPLLSSVRESSALSANTALGFLPCITRGMEGRELTEMAELRDAGAVGFTDDGLPVRDANVLRRALQYQQMCGGVLVLHEEDASLSGAGVMHEGTVSALLGLTGIPSVAESTAIARDAALAGYEAGRIHVMHVSAADSVTVVRAAKEAGVRISAEVCPHHLLMTEDAVRPLDTSMKMNPPLRSEQDRAVLRDALIDGTLDCVATDHAPHAREEKEVPFEEAPMGTTGLETAFAALHSELVVPGIISLELLVTRMTAGAALFELPTARIAPGEPANVCLVDLQRSWTVGASGYVSRSTNSFLDGHELRGRVLMTIAAGAVRFALDDQAGAG
jgi:dihydroorotase